MHVAGEIGHIGDISTVMLSWCEGIFMRAIVEIAPAAPAQAAPGPAPTLARMFSFDTVIIGSWLLPVFCAAQAGQRGLKVLLIDHADKVAEKIRISGGGRCNFTNRDLDASAPHKHFVSQNPQFCRSALSRYTPQDFIALVQKHGIAFHEKHKGQLFADRSAEDIIAMLLAECALGQVERWQPCSVKNIAFLASGGRRDEARSSYQIDTDRGPVQARSVVVATGGLSIPKIGASDLGYRLAQQFGIPLVERRRTGAAHV